MEISNKESLHNYLSSLSENPADFAFKNANSEFDKFLIQNVTLHGLKFSSCDIIGKDFKGCMFTNCSFDNHEFNGVSFTDCVFKQPVFQSTVFMDCSIKNCEFYDSFSNQLYFGMTSFDNVIFKDGELLQYVTFSDCMLSSLSFTNVQIFNGKFESGNFSYMFKSTLLFTSCELSSITFIDLDLTATIFARCNLGLAFINSNLAKNSFIDNQDTSHCNIDLATIKNSIDLPTEVLKNIFRITTPLVKEIINNITKPINEMTVFISYSFKDEKFAEELNSRLLAENITTFFWKRNADGGAKMMEIMDEKIREYDFFIFIASSNSLKSKACHFELSKARIKYSKTWENILFPVHIDNFLFEVEEYNIPISERKEFWENIIELREFHSLNFSDIGVNLNNINKDSFEKLFSGLNKNFYITKKQ